MERSNHGDEKAAIEELVKRIPSVMQKVQASVKQELKKIEEERDNVKRELHETTTALKKSDQENASFQHRLDQMEQQSDNKQELQAMQGKCDEAIRELIQVQNALGSIQRDNVVLANHLASAQKQIEVNECEKGQRAAEKQQLVAEQEDGSRAEKRVLDNSVELQYKIDEMSANIKHAEDALEKERMERADLQHRFDKEGARSRTAMRELESQRAVSNDLRQKSDAIVEEIRTLEFNMSEQRRLTEKHELDTAVANRSALQQKKAMLALKIQGVDQQLQHIETALIKSSHSTPEKSDGCEHVFKAPSSPSLKRSAQKRNHSSSEGSSDGDNSEPIKRNFSRWDEQSNQSSKRAEFSAGES